MADPLSVAASVITVLATGAACANGLSSLIQSIRNAPEELLALSNEVNNLNAIIDETQKVCESLALDDLSNVGFIETFARLLQEAGDVLGTLNELLSIYKSKTRRIDQSVVWLRWKTRAQKCLMKMHNVKTNIQALLASKNMDFTLRINMEIQEVRFVCEQMLQRIDSIPTAIIEHLMPQPGSSQSLLTNNAVNPSGIHSSSQQNSGIAQNSSAEISSGHSSSSTSENVSLHEQGDIAVVSQSTTCSMPRTQVSNQSFSNSVVWFRMYKQRKCDPSCDCSCHSSYRYRTPLMLGNLIGILGYAGSSLLRSKCEKSTCQNRASKSFQLTYCFPQWFLEKAIHFVAAMTYTGTPQFGLWVRRRVRWGSEDGILRFALTGNTVGVKLLLNDGKASMTDVDPNYGRTALYYAIQHNQIETCEFLLNEGADPHDQDDYGISCYQQAWEQVFTRYRSPESLLELQRLFPKEEISDTWEFSRLHKIVLSILPLSLERTLQDQQYRDQVNLRDYKGRIPLHWAAIRGDVPEVTLLLDNGSDVDAQDDVKATPLILAASSGSVRTLELLLLAGANVHLTDIRGGHALNYVCRHQNNLEPVKLLLRAGSPVNRKNIYGHTPFIGAAIKNRYEIGMHLLRHGADMHSSSNNNNDTPLFETIFHNNHEFLQLLLDEGANHKHVNKSGCTILHAAALEADVKTIEILAASKPGGLDVDSLDKNGKTAFDISRQRIASPPGFQESFERFLTIVRGRNHVI